MLQVLDTVLDQLARIAVDREPEWGGALLGMADRPTVTEFMFDGDAAVTSASYVPSPKIAAAVKERELGSPIIEYKGVLHRHPDWLDKPSSGDERSLEYALQDNPQLAVHLAPIVTRRNSGEPLRAHELGVGDDFKVGFYGARRTRNGRIRVTPEPVTEIPFGRDLRVTAARLGFERPGDPFLTHIDGAPCLAGVLALGSGQSMMVVATPDYPFSAPIVLRSGGGRTDQLGIAWRLDMPANQRLPEALAAALEPVAPAAASAVKAENEAQDNAREDDEIETPSPTEPPIVPPELQEPPPADMGPARSARDHWARPGRIIRGARCLVHAGERPMLIPIRVAVALPRLCWRFGRSGVRGGFAAARSITPLARQTYGPTKELALTRDRARARTAGWHRSSGADPDRTAASLLDELSSRSKGLIDSLNGRTVVVVGLGSVGSYLAEILCRSGVGRLVVIDPEEVEPANLSRTTYEIGDIGRPKVDALGRRLLNVNPTVVVDRYSAAIELMPAGERAALVSSADLVIAATDSMPAQRLINHQAYEAGVPAIFIGLYRGAQGGEVIYTVPGRTACYICATSRRHSLLGSTVAPETDYGTSRLAGEVALAADIQHVASAAAKISLALLVRDSSMALSGFLEPLIEAGTNYLTLSMTPDYWFYPSIFEDTAGQFAWQSVWLTPTGRTECPVCGDVDHREAPRVPVHVATDAIRRASDAA